MKICNIEQLVNQNYNAVLINTLKQLWQTTKFFQCFGKPKKHNLFLFLNGCSITYTDKSKRTVVAKSGDLVYTPIGSEYKAQLSDFKDEASHTVGINFLLLDEMGESVILSNDILVFRGSDYPALPLLFGKVLRRDAYQPLAKSRIALMEILCAIATPNLGKPSLDSVTKALDYLTEHIEDNPTVAELSSLSGVSEVYFRKLFRAHMGVSPSEYRNSQRLERARSYLEYGEISVQEISDSLGYSTVSHFIKEFKRKHGVSPLRYRRQRRGIS